MLEKPALDERLILAHLRDAYDMPVSELVFLPLGADANTAVYRAVAGGAPYFVKLRGGEFEESAVAVPHFLSEQGIRAIIAPLPTQAGRLWDEIGGYRLILYPFIESRDAYEVEWTAGLWREFGAALRHIHDVDLPPALAGLVRREAFSPRWRERLREFLQLAATRDYEEPAAAAMAALLNRRRPCCNRGRRGSCCATPTCTRATPSPTPPAVSTLSIGTSPFSPRGSAT